MHPHKTALARDTLQSHRAPLDLRQRRLLILADGQRDIAELTRMLGEDTPARIRELCAAGYLQGDVDEAPPPTPAAPVHAPAPVTARQAPTQAPAASPDTPHERRRSLAAARMYIQGMLELQRHPQAVELRQRLQFSRDEQAAFATILAALAALPAITSASYAERVRQRVAEVLPEALLPQLPAAETT